MISVRKGPDAWKSLLKAGHGRWAHDIARFAEPLAKVHHEPRFPIGSRDRVFCMGSCFARNVEEHLIYNGVQVLSRRIVCPPEEWTGARVNGFVNKFTTLSMLNELDWQIERPEITKDFFEPTGNAWRDLQLSRGTPSVSLERAIERRAYLIDHYFSRVREADVVILTLGLNETWYDNRTARYLNEAPSPSSVRSDPDRYILEITDVATNVAALERIHERLQSLRPGIRVVVTVSPVPMFATFSGRDVAVANTYSKSVLRCAAEEFAANHASVDYYPSYEMVALSPRTSAYAADCLHVSDTAVGELIRQFLLLYTGKEPVATDFNEIAYIAANQDVEAAVRRGELESGFEHWTKFGREEGRLLRPAQGTKLDLVRSVGA